MRENKGAPMNQGASSTRRRGSHGGRVIAALAAKFRDLDLAEEAFAEACLNAAQSLAQGRRAP
jgi:predicted RNA polymerase sigma factor